MATKLYLGATVVNPTPLPQYVPLSATNPKYTRAAVEHINELDMGTTAGSGAVSGDANSDATTATRTQYFGRWNSPTLAAQSIAAGTWTIALEGSEASTNADSFLSLAVYTCAAGGSAKATTIYDSSTDVGTEWATTRTGQVITFSGAGVSVTAGHILCLELWRNTDATGQAMATAYLQSVYFNGATDVTAGSTTAGGSYLLTPAAVTLTFGSAATYTPKPFNYQPLLAQ